ncbi:hypothetical protein P2318_14185 [Myxococcaceae bacterium GXIMD 01537]
MQMHCEVCRSPLGANDVRLDLALARCHSCNAVYDLSGRKGRALDATTPARTKLVRAPAALPDRFGIEDDGTTTRISWRWFKRQTLFLAAFCVLWVGFLFVWYTNILSRPNPPLTHVIGPIIHVAIGVALTYKVLTDFINSTVVEVNRSRLSIRHGPLPWSGNQSLAGGTLTQLYGEEVLGTENKRGERTITYSLVAMDRRGRKVKLVTGLEDKDQVLYLEQALERRLGIEDKPVDGEVATRLLSA